MVAINFHGSEIILYLRTSMLQNGIRFLNTRMRRYQEKSFVKEVAYRGVDFQVGFDFQSCDLTEKVQ